MDWADSMAGVVRSVSLRNMVSSGCEWVAGLCGSKDGLLGVYQ